MISEKFKNIINEKNKKRITIIFTVVIIVVIIWFLIISPYIQFKKSENKVLEAGKRYFELNSTQLPTGEKVKTISLQTLYNKDFITEDIQIPNSKKTCDEKSSWIKVRKKDNEYQYYVYLKCGIFSSSVDHTGPTITLNGDDEITINKGDEYKDPGVKSVTDNTDGKMDIKEVTVDTSQVDTSKNGTYQVTYTIKDSLNNETAKTRTVKVVQILDKIVENDTDKTNYYKGQNNNNYIKLDGILFKIVGLNDDGTVKITSTDPLAFIDYNSVDTWLNDYFYEKLSDSAKEYIVSSKWCNEKITDTENYTECNSYSKKKNVGLLSVADINNSKDSEGNSNLAQWQYSWTGNTKNSKAIKEGSNEIDYTEVAKTSISGIRPTLNLKKNITISSGDGTNSNPFVLKGNKSSLKAGDKISEAKTGEYITYSGYRWRIIEKESDDTTKVVMDGIVQNSGEYITMDFDSKTGYYNTENKSNIGYNIVNSASKYVSTKLFTTRSIEIYSYKNKVAYETKVSSKKYKVKLSEVSLFELYSASSEYNYWFRESTNAGNAYSNDSLGDVLESKIASNNSNLLKLTANLDKNISVKSGKGTIDNPYSIVN